MNMTRTQIQMRTLKRTMNDEHYEIKLISNRMAHELILTKHYAHRIPSLSYCFGLFRNDELVGVITYGTPPSSTLCKGICGDEFQSYVLELNRLVLRDNLKNEASLLIGNSFKLLPSPSIIVSFADTAQNHFGKVYQATNFLYTGLSAKFKDAVVKGLEHQHHTSFGKGLSVKAMKEKYGEERVYWKERSRKHRYIYFIGNKMQRTLLMNALKYPIMAYPKNNHFELLGTQTGG
jgi:hypothetical protein